MCSSVEHDGFSGAQKLKFDLRSLSIDLGVKIVATNSHSGLGVETLKNILTQELRVPKKPFYPVRSLAEDTIDKIKSSFDIAEDYRAYQYAQQNVKLNFLSEEQRKQIEQIKSDTGFYDVPTQSQEVLGRYTLISETVDRNIKTNDVKELSLSQKADKIITHKFFGYAIFAAILLLIFQAIFAWSEWPMTFIEEIMAGFSSLVSEALPEEL